MKGFQKYCTWQPSSIEDYCSSFMQITRSAAWILIFSAFLPKTNCQDGILILQHDQEAISEKAMMRKKNWAKNLVSLSF
jgi:hypothetical protein